MADEVTLRIRFEGDGQGGRAAPAADSVRTPPPQPTQVPAGEPKTQLREPARNTALAAANQPPVPAGVTPPWWQSQGGAGAAPFAGAAPKLPDLLKELDQFWSKLAELNAAMDPAAVSQRVDQEIRLRQEQEKLNAAMDAQRRLIDPQSFNALNKEWAEWRKEMGRLSEAMDPEAVRQRVKMELALAEARGELSRRMAEERERMLPTARQTPPPVPAGESKSFMGGLLDLLGGLRGTIGGKLGPVVGGGLDVMSAARKAMAGAGKAGMGKGGETEVGAAEGAEAGEMAGAAEAAGPAAVIVAAMEASHAIEQAFVGAIHGVGQFTDSLVSASSDPGEYLQSLGEPAEALGEKLSYVSLPLGMFIGGLGAAADELGKFMQVMDATVDRYAAYSPEVATAKAMADVTQTMGDIRRAQEIGPDLSAFVNEESKLRQNFENEKIKILHALLPLATDAMKVLNSAMPLIDLAIQPIIAVLESIQKFLEKMGWAQANKPDTDFDLPTGDVLFRHPFKFNPEGSRVAPGA